MHKRNKIFTVGLSTFVLLIFAIASTGLMGSAQSQKECQNCVTPETVTCPPGYHEIRITTSYGTTFMCAPNSQSGTTSERNNQLPSGTTPPGPPPNRPSQPPARGPFKQKSPSMQQGPGQNKMFKESPPKGVVPSPKPPSINKLFVRYYGSLTTTGYTYLGGWLPCYAKLSTGGRLIIWERYPSGRTIVRDFGWRPPGWNKFFFYGDQPGWHALTINVNGKWCNWIWVFVS